LFERADLLLIPSLKRGNSKPGSQRRRGHIYAKAPIDLMGADEITSFLLFLLESKCMLLEGMPPKQKRETCRRRQRY
jgi:hypothetical protein